MHRNAQYCVHLTFLLLSSDYATGFMSAFITRTLPMAANKPPNAHAYFFSPSQLNLYNSVAFFLN